MTTRIKTRVRGSKTTVDVTGTVPKTSGRTKVVVKDNSEVRRSRQKQIVQEYGSVESSDTIDDNNTTDDSDLEQEIKYPISDDTMDALEAEVDALNSTQNIGEKVRLHTKLKESIQALSKEIDDMVEIVDKIDIDSVSADLKREMDRDDGTDIADDIVNLDKVFEKLQEEDVLQKKIEYMQKLTTMVQRCKARCDTSRLRIASCK